MGFPLEFWISLALSVCSLVVSVLGVRALADNTAALWANTKASGQTDRLPQASPLAVNQDRVGGPEPPWHFRYYRYIPVGLLVMLFWITAAPTTVSGGQVFSACLATLAIVFSTCLALAAELAIRVHKPLSDIAQRYQDMARQLGESEQALHDAQKGFLRSTAENELLIQEVTSKINGLLDSASDPTNRVSSRGDA